MLWVYAGGYFAKNAALLGRVGSVLLEPSSRLDTRLTRWLVAKDAFDIAEKPVSQAIYQVWPFYCSLKLHAHKYIYVALQSACCSF